MGTCATMVQAMQPQVPVERCCTETEIKPSLDPESLYSTHAATDLNLDLVLRDPGAAANPEWLCLAARLGECVPRGGDADHVNQSGGTEVASLSDPHETPMGRDLKGGSHIGRAKGH